MAETWVQEGNQVKAIRQINGPFVYCTPLEAISKRTLHRKLDLIKGKKNTLGSLKIDWKTPIQHLQYEQLYEQTRLT